MVSQLYKYNGVVKLESPKYLNLVIQPYKCVGGANQHKIVVHIDIEFDLKTKLLTSNKPAVPRAFGPVICGVALLRA